MTKFSPDELENLAKLPPEIAALADKYPVEIVNAAEFWNDPLFPDNYIPHLVEIYYGNTDGPDVFVMDGELISFHMRHLEAVTPIIAVQIDDQWAYIQIKGQEILNRLGGVVFPDVIINPTTFLHSVLKGGEQ